MRVKFGIDPTAPDLHLGNAVPLRKLRQFQNEGHQAVLIIGDFTATIGDPSGRAAARKPLTPEEIQENMKKYLRQAGKILDSDKLEVRYNSEWLSKLTAAEILKLMAMFTVQQLTQREDFSKRLKENKPVGMHELMYPIFQGYDSVGIKADLEIGGVDQTLNLLAGRHLMEKMGMKPQEVLTLPLLIGTDGVRKMSKSLGNYISLEEEPNEMFGKIMSINDELMPQYFELLTDLKMPEGKNPRETKLLLAKTIVAMYHSEEAARGAEENFVRVFSKKETPEEMPEVHVEESHWALTDLLLKTGVKSKSEARRLIRQGGVKIDSEAQKDVEAVVSIKDGSVLQIGKRKFFKLKTP